jgi:hypothetical protein
VELISGIAMEGFLVDEHDWSRVFGRLDSQHPLTIPFLKRFEARLPGGVIDAMLLSAANNACDFKICGTHIFDSGHGVARLREFLGDFSEKNVEAAWQAAKAIRWIRQDCRAELLALASRHSSRDVKVELEAGIAALLEFCLDPVFSRLAQSSLEEVGAKDRIPSRCGEPDFDAMCEMNHWLCFPSEFGRPPTELSVVFSRRIFWPPAEEVLDISLVRYVYRDVEPVDIGIGCTGSRTFAIFSIPTADLSSPDLLGLYCAREGMEPVDLSTEEGVREAIDAGLEWIKSHNPGALE